MAQFAIFNYQFDKFVKQSRQYELEGMNRDVMSADEAFPKKQEIFGELLQKDFVKANQEDVIHFRSKAGIKEYIHRHLMPPTDDITVMRIANRRTQTIVDVDLNEKCVDDYQNCIVIIDNRPGIQRILIENKKTAFADVKQVEGILTNTFNQLLLRYGLVMSLYHLQDDRVFWQCVSDNRLYPQGFYKISFHLPYPNLERLKTVYERLFNKARESFDTRINMDFVAPKGGKIRLDENDSYQKETIGWLMADAGADIKLYSNDSKKSPIPIGRESFRVVTISNPTLLRLSEDAVNGDLFGSPALEEVKRVTKTGIDPDQ